jgi:hypothetical protein
MLRQQFKRMSGQHELRMSIPSAVQEGIHELALPLYVQRKLRLVNNEYARLTSGGKDIAQEEQELLLSRRQHIRIQYFAALRSDLEAFSEMKGNGLSPVEGIYYLYKRADLVVQGLQGIETKFETINVWSENLMKELRMFASAL